MSFALVDFEVVATDRWVWEGDGVISFATEGDGWFDERELLSLFDAIEHDEFCEGSERAHQLVMQEGFITGVVTSNSRRVDNRRCANSRCVEGGLERTI